MAYRYSPSHCVLMWPFLCGYASLISLFVCPNSFSYMYTSQIGLGPAHISSFNYLSKYSYILFFFPSSLPSFLPPSLPPFLPSFLLSFLCVGSLLLRAGFSLVAASGGYSSLQCVGFSLWCLLLLQNTGSRYSGFSSCGSWALERRLSSCGTRA